MFKMKSLVWLLLLLQQTACRLIIYPHATGAPQSDKFRVFLTRNLLTEESFVYMASSDHRVSETKSAYPGRTVSWTSFAFDYAPVIVHVKTVTDFKTCVIRPDRYRYGCSRSDVMQATFAITANATTMSVEFDTDQPGPEKDITNKLLIFADPPETQVPNKGDPEVMYYDVGMHDLDGVLALPEGMREVYLAPGAFVEGGFRSTATHPVRIHGRGVLDTRKYVWHDPRFDPATITLETGSGHVVEGITLSDPPRFLLHAPASNVTVSNVKTVASWAYNNDGVTMGEGGMVFDSFFHVNDDAIKLYASNLTVERVVVWQAQNGAVFQFGWDKSRDVHYVTVNTVDVIHTDWCTFRGDLCHELSDNDAVYDIGGNATSHISGSYLMFTDIHVEGYCPRIFRFLFPPYCQGIFANVTFQNLQIDSQDNPNPNFRIYNEIGGYGRTGRVEHWYFLNFVISNACVDDPTKRNIWIQSGTTDNIWFECPQY